MPGISLSLTAVCRVFTMMETPTTEGPLQRLDARAKLLGLLGIVVISVSTPSASYRCLLVLGLVVAGLAVIGRLSSRTLLRRALPLTPFLLLAATLPLVRPEGGREQAIGESLKALLGCLVLVLLAASTPVDRLLLGLAGLGLPRLAVMLIGLLLRYLHLLSDESQRLHRAAVLRGYRARFLAQAVLVGRLVGVLFLRSHARAERVHAAMLARGFDGLPVPAVLPRLRWADFAFVVLVLGSALAVRLTLA